MTARHTPEEARLPRRRVDESVKGTLVSIVIAFSLTLVFRSFVVEAFIIPTGSMAPTLLGRHVRMHGYQNGFSWAVNAHRAGAIGSADAVEPMTQLALGQRGLAARPGDRILVLKHAYALTPPKRWDVVVFKNPEHPGENYIKRLIGLPNERVWIADGDVFVQDTREHNDAHNGWRIMRKPAHVQRDVWWPIASSELAPLERAPGGEPWAGPWLAEGPIEWDHARRRYEAPTGDLAALRWDGANWPINDWTPYNEPLRDGADLSRTSDAFYTSDVRVRATIEAHDEGLAFEALLETRGKQFLAVVHDGAASLLMRDDGARSWTEAATAVVGAFADSKPVAIEFWHVDQTVQLWIDGRRVCFAAYEWGPWERLARAMGVTAPDVEALAQRPGRNFFEQRDAARPAKLALALRGAPATIHRVGLDRDIHYTAETFHEGPEIGTPARGTHPAHAVRLRADQFFVLGDNSAASKDGRTWDVVDPWVGSMFDPTPGVVHRDLMLGKAFFVYFPAPHDMVVGRGVYSVIPDFGRTRFIR